ncbi:DUF4232 domain-containing protein [Streptomyces sp. NPDC093094]|uniref:DUF4232 domain-containing protein n=1 Tax=Streptomyces sp. NPDC093094 TaxID=3366026 RepID=UPI00381A5B96
MRRPLISAAVVLLLSGAAGCSSSGSDDTPGKAPGPASAGTTAGEGPETGGTPGGDGPATTGDSDSSDDGDGTADGEATAPSSPPPGVLFGADRLPTPAADRCRTGDLTAAARSTGRGRVSVVLTNRGDGSCTVRGFPSLLFVGEAGRTELPVDWAGSAEDAPEVDLSPGASASAELTFTSLDECEPLARLDVVPPGESRPLDPAFTTPGGDRTEVRICDTGVRVQAFTPEH